MYAEAQRTYLGNIVVCSVVILFSPLTFVFVRSVRSLLLRRHDLRKGSRHTWTVWAWISLYEKTKTGWLKYSKYTPSECNVVWLTLLDFLFTERHCHYLRVTLLNSRVVHEWWIRNISEIWRLWDKWYCTCVCLDGLWKIRNLRVADVAADAQTKYIRNLRVAEVAADAQTNYIPSTNVGCCYCAKLRVVWAVLGFVILFVLFGNMSLFTYGGVKAVRIVRGIVLRFPAGAIDSSPKRPDQIWEPPTLLFTG
jgi:hypothetical protein